MSWGQVSAENLEEVIRHGSNFSLKQTCLIASIYRYELEIETSCIIHYNHIDYDYLY